jgi:hypothetical protein
VSNDRHLRTKDSSQTEGCEAELPFAACAASRSDSGRFAGAVLVLIEKGENSEFFTFIGEDMDNHPHIPLDAAVAFPKLSG